MLQLSQKIKSVAPHLWMLCTIPRSTLYGSASPIPCHLRKSQVDLHHVILLTLQGTKDQPYTTPPRLSSLWLRVRNPQVAFAAITMCVYDMYIRGRRGSHVKFVFGDWCIWLVLCWLHAVCGAGNCLQHQRFIS
jgi:hypothetical protein